MRAKLLIPISFLLVLACNIGVTPPAPVTNPSISQVDIFQERWFDPLVEMLPF